MTTTGGRYEVYTMRRTSSRTVYAIYDNLASRPVCHEGTNHPVTFNDRRQAQELVYRMGRDAGHGKWKS